MAQITVTISNDVSNMGPDGTEEELQEYAKLLEGRLKVIDEHIVVKTGPVVATEVSGDVESLWEIAARVFVVEDTEWLNIVNQVRRSCDVTA